MPKPIFVSTSSKDRGEFPQIYIFLFEKEYTMLGIQRNLQVFQS